MKRINISQIISIAVLVAVTVVLAFIFKRKVVTTERQPTLPAEQAETKYTPIVNDAYDTDAPEENGDVTTDLSEGEPELPSWILKETAPVSNKYIEQIVFIGDRTIGNMSRTGAVLELPRTTEQIWSPDAHISVEDALDSFIIINNEYTNYITAVNSESPQYIIITLGSYSDIGVNKNSFVTAYSHITNSIKAASPSSQIIIQSILPVGIGCEVVTPGEIIERNEWLKGLCESEGIYYLDTWSVLSDSDGYLILDYYNPDNYQDDYPNYYLNSTGYSRMIEYIRTHAYPTYSE